MSLNITHLAVSTQLQIFSKCDSEDHRSIRLVCKTFAKMMDGIQFYPGILRLQLIKASQTIHLKGMGDKTKAFLEMLIKKNEISCALKLLPFFPESKSLEKNKKKLVQLSIQEGNLEVINEIQSLEQNKNQTKLLLAVFEKTLSLRGPQLAMNDPLFQMLLENGCQNEVYSALALFYARTGDEKSAQSMADYLSGESKKWCEIDIVETLAENGHFEQAIFFAKKLNPEDQEKAHEHIFRASSKLGNEEIFTHFLSQTSQLNGQNHTVEFVQALILQKKGERALKWNLSMKGTWDSTLETWYEHCAQLTSLFIKQGLLIEAASLIKELPSSNQKKWNYSLAIEWAKKGDIKESVRLFKELEVDEKDFALLADITIERRDDTGLEMILSLMTNEKRKRKVQINHLVKTLQVGDYEKVFLLAQSFQKKDDEVYSCLALAVIKSRQNETDFFAQYNKIRDSEARLYVFRETISWCLKNDQISLLKKISGGIAKVEKNWNPFMLALVKEYALKGNFEEAFQLSLESPKIIQVPLFHYCAQVAIENKDWSAARKFAVFIQDPALRLFTWGKLLAEFPKQS